MNNKLYRVIFNKTRGMLMVVSEIASGNGKGSSGHGAISGLGATLTRRLFAYSLLQLNILFALGWYPINVNANIITDASAPGNQQPTVLQSANGTPQVNIQTPSKGGVSRNKYSQLDVDQRGVILNNSRTNTSTELGGMVSGNPWLAKGEAGIILNEVNSRNASQLNGYIEVAGRKAQVVIANPSGITCDGCGFINASRATLTTGQAQLNGGSLTGYRIESGAVRIEGAGMDTSRLDYTDIIARSVEINAGLWANNLRVTTGQNQVDTDNQITGSVSSETSERPRLAVDVSQLGGMYAGSIHLVGTEYGVGVRNAGHIGTEAGHVVVTVEGLIENSGSLNSAQDLNVNAKVGVTNQGTLYASQETLLNTAGLVSNQEGTIAAGRHTRIDAGSVSSTSDSVLAAGVTGEGSLNVATQKTLQAGGQNLAADTIVLRGAALDLSGSQTHATELNLTATQGDLRTVKASLSAEGTLAASAAHQIVNDQGTLEADTVTLTAQALSNRQGNIRQLGISSLTLSYQGQLNNTQGTIASNGTDITLTAQGINNHQGMILAAKGDISLNSQQLFNNQEGRLEAQGDLFLSSAQVNNQSGTLFSHNQTIRTGAFNNQSGTIVANASLNLNSQALNNQSGTIQSQQTAINTNKQSLSNQQGNCFLEI